MTTQLYAKKRLIHASYTLQSKEIWANCGLAVNPYVGFINRLYYSKSSEFWEYLTFWGNKKNSNILSDTRNNPLFARHVLIKLTKKNINVKTKTWEAGVFLFPNKCFICYVKYTLSYLAGFVNTFLYQGGAQIWIMFNIRTQMMIIKR